MYTLALSNYNNNMFYFAGNVNFAVSIFEGTRSFEIYEGDSVTVTGQWSNFCFE